MTKKISNSKDGSEEETKFPLPIYKEEDDIYNREKEEHLEENDPAEANLDIDLDVPGAELDDKDEKIGEEDEENNYYSIGGDDHNELEEDPEE
jgi:hypothetical protein